MFQTMFLLPKQLSFHQPADGRIKIAQLSSNAAATLASALQLPE
jgi:hypothetical protein